MIDSLKQFLKLESASGILLIIAACLALIAANTAFSTFYTSFLHLPLSLQLGPIELDKPLYHWVDDGLMVLFFLLIGLEVKREFLTGHLSQASQVVLPGFAAIGGIVVPALVYMFIVRDHPELWDGWAIPAATDIAFALGILALLGNRVPVALKIFLMTLAIIDDLAAIIIIAIFYTHDLSINSGVFALLIIVALCLLNRLGVVRKAPYILLGIVLWFAVLKSGVHATLAGVVLAFTIPMKTPNKQPSPLLTMEHGLHPWVAFIILPIFAFTNAGIALGDLQWKDLVQPLPLGIAMGLFIGKQIGVFGFTWIALKLKWAKIPEGCNMMAFYGVSLLTGVGFTMSLFISSLAFDGGAGYGDTDKLGILMGSLLSAFIGYFVLSRAIKSFPSATPAPAKMKKHHAQKATD